jgi:hypothetical protein
MRGTIVAALAIILLGVIVGAVYAFLIAPTPSGDTEKQQAAANKVFDKIVEMAGPEMSVSLTFDGPGGPECDVVTRAMEAELGRHPAAWRRLMSAIMQDQKERRLYNEFSTLDRYTTERRCDKFTEQARKIMTLLGLELPTVELPDAADVASPMPGRGDAQTTQGKEEILEFESEIEISNDGSLIVTEQITVVALGKAIKRGIYRQFSESYRDQRNKLVRMFFDIQEVMRDGGPVAHRTTTENGATRIYIGKGDEFLTPGEHTFTIRYKAYNQVAALEDSDELYWPVTGKWNFPIGVVRVTIKAPTSQAPSAVQPYVNNVADDPALLNTSEAAGGGIAITTTRGLAPNVELALVLSWPKGAVLGHGPLAEPGEFRLEASGARPARFSAECSFNVGNRWHDVTFEEEVPYAGTLSVHGLYCEFMPRGGEVELSIKSGGAPVWQGKGSGGRLTAYVYPTTKQ